MGMIIGRSLTPLNSSRTLGPSADVRRSAAVTTTRAGRCRMSVDTARLLMEEIDYSVLFRWFVGLGLDEPIWSQRCSPRIATACFEGDVAAMRSLMWSGIRRKLRSSSPMEHFPVDGRSSKPGHAGRQQELRRGSFVTTLRGAGITPHVAQTTQSPAIEQRATTRPPRLCHRSAQRQIGRAGLRLDANHRPDPEATPSPRGARGLDVYLSAAAYNLVRLRTWRLGTITQNPHADGLARNRSTEPSGGTTDGRLCYFSSAC